MSYVSPCILSRCVCLLFVLHLQLMTTEIVNSQLQPLPYHCIEISWNYKESSTNICCWDFTFDFASHIGCVDDEILREKVYVDFLLPYSCSIQSIPSIRRQILTVCLLACILQPKGSYNLLITWRPLNTGINIFGSAIIDEEAFACIDSLLLYQRGFVNM